jgi:hypothetical protein
MVREPLDLALEKPLVVIYEYSGHEQVWAIATLKREGDAPKVGNGLVPTAAGQSRNAVGTDRKLSQRTLIRFACVLIFSVSIMTFN